MNTAQQFWSAAGSEAPRRFRIDEWIQISHIAAQPKAVSPPHSATAFHIKE